MIFNPCFKSDSFIPAGLIAMWGGVASDIPNGWNLCDGTNGTPDLRDRFIVGAGNTYSVGDSGGADKVTLTTEQMPQHSHEATISNDLKVENSESYTGTINVVSTQGNYKYSPDGSIASCGSGSGGYTDSWSRNSSGGFHATLPEHGHTLTGSVSVTNDNAGSGQAHENRPPYYALCYIMKL